MNLPTINETRTRVAVWSQLGDRQPAYALVSNVDLVVIRFDDRVAVMYGRCHHRGALLADGHIDGQNLICGVHGWDYRYDTGVSEYNNDEALHRFAAVVDEALSANVRETRSTQRIRVGRRQRNRTCWDCEREWKRMVVPLEPGRPSEARQLLRTQR